MYTALYRKLRPANFSEIIAQDHIVRTLQNQILNDRIGHAYLFCGTRGTGKTSCAKVFAKAVCCVAPVNGDACGVCIPCDEINAGVSLDVIEIDAASNNGVDNIRDLRDEVRYPPVTGRRKVYIIDEVHMLSTGAFNALLKTLEEPPSHVMFILATTDPHRIPPTIHSRLMRFDFYRISPLSMADALKGYMAAENISITDEAVEYVAEQLSDGAMRDALSIIDRCVGLYFGEQITLEKVLEVTGSVDQSVFFEFARGIFARDVGACLKVVDDITARGRDIGQFNAEFLATLRNLLLFILPGSRDGLFLSNAARQHMESLVNITNYEDVISKINIFSDLRNRLRYSSNDRIQLEIAAVRACSLNIVNAVNVAAASMPVNDDIIESLLERLNKLEQMKISSASSIAPTAPPPPPAQKEKAIPADVQKVIAEWKDFCRDMDAADGALLSQAKPGFLEDSYLYLVCPSPFLENQLRKKTEAIEAALEKRYGKAFNVHAIGKTFYDDRHKKKYGSDDSATPTKTANEFEEIKSKINFPITEE